jgi:MFS family permease
MSAPQYGTAAPTPQRPALATVAIPLAFACVITVSAYWAVDITAPAINDIKDGLLLSGAGAGLISSLFFFGRLLGNFPASWLLHRVGPAVTAAIGSAALAIGGLVGASTSSVPVMYAVRTLEGAGVAFIVTSMLLAILRARPGDGSAMALFSWLTTIGGVFGLVTGGAFTGYWSWRAVFVTHYFLGAAIFLIAGLSLIRSHKAGSAAVSAVDVAVAAAPLRVVAMGVAANFLAFVDYAIFAIALPLFVKDRYELDAGRLTVLILVITITHLAASFPAGTLIRRHGTSRVLIGGNVLAAIGMVTMPWTPAPWWLLSLPLGVYGVGQMLAVAAAGDFILQKGGRGPRAVGFVRLSSDIGLVVGPFLMGRLADWQGVVVPFYALTALTLIGIIFVSRRLVDGGRPAAAA